MSETIRTAPNRNRISRFVISTVPSWRDASFLTGSALLTVLSFPDFDLWFLAWASLAPLLIFVVRAPRVSRAFVGGWLWGTIFFYGTCWWLTYPMIHYGHLSAWLAYPLLLLPVFVGALFPALFCAGLSQVTRSFGYYAILLAPIIWVACEWGRYAVTGQLWNALGYSQAFHPVLIQSAHWGGVYAVGFLLVILNTSVALFIFARWRIATLVLSITLLVTLAVSYGSHSSPALEPTALAAAVVAIQPNVPMDLAGDPAAMDGLLDRHLMLTNTALLALQTRVASLQLPRLVIWPESPMNFSYSRDPHLREVVGDFARASHASILLNSLEPAANGGEQNSAILVNEQGEIAARYDKIRLMPFGEYVPLPQWLPGARSVRAIVGEFTPGSSYTLMPLGAIRAGVFICIEAAHPGVARSFTHDGADVLINISNDGYLGPTPVMRQHLSNAIFRAVENNRPLLRVTNSGITAYIDANGQVSDQTNGFQEATRSWTISKGPNSSTFYSRHGEVFAYACALISLGIISASFGRRRLGTHASGVLSRR